MLEPHQSVLSGFRLVLASGSPRRKEILSQAGLKFESIPSTCEENLDKKAFKSQPWLYAERTAKMKALEVFTRLSPEREENGQSKGLLVVGADTIVTLNEVIYGKPRNEEEAFQTLSRLSGKSHEVYTGVCLMKGGGETSEEPMSKLFHVKTRVHFDQLSNDVIRGYIATGESFDKAGGYGIQARGGTLITGIEGDYFNVMGLPLNAFCKQLIDVLA